MFEIAAEQKAGQDECNNHLEAAKNISFDKGTPCVNVTVRRVRSANIDTARKKENGNDSVNGFHHSEQNQKQNDARKKFIASDDLRTDKIGCESNREQQTFLQTGLHIRCMQEGGKDIDKQVAENQPIERGGNRGALA